MSFTMAPKKGASASQLQILSLLVGCGVIYQLIFHCVDFLQTQGGDEDEQQVVHRMRGSAQDLASESHGDLSDSELEELELSVDITTAPPVQVKRRVHHIASMADLYAPPEDEEEESDDAETEEVDTSATKSELARKIKARPLSLADLYTQSNKHARSAGLNIRRSAHVSESGTLSIGASQDCVRPSAAEEWLEMLELLAAHQCPTGATREQIKEMYTAPGGMRRLFSRLADSRAGEDAVSLEPPSPRTGVKLARSEQTEMSKTSGLNIRVATSVPSTEPEVRRIRLR